MNRSKGLFFFLKILLVLPAIFGLIIVIGSSISILFIEGNYEARIVKIISVTGSNSGNGSEYLSGIAINTEDSLMIDIVLRDLIRLGICKNQEEIGNFLVQRDSIIPIWFSPTRFRSKVRIGDAETSNYFIKEYLNGLVFSIVLCIPFLVIHILQKIIWKE